HDKILGMFQLRSDILRKKKQVEIEKAENLINEVIYSKPLQA
ncbi:9854_t:CDS:1, partial [Diversispora eburnea]